MGYPRRGWPKGEGRAERSGRGRPLGRAPLSERRAQRGAELYRAKRGTHSRAKRSVARARIAARLVKRSEDQARSTEQACWRNAQLMAMRCVRPGPARRRVADGRLRRVARSPASATRDRPRERQRLRSIGDRNAMKLYSEIETIHNAGSSGMM